MSIAAFTLTALFQLLSGSLDSIGRAEAHARAVQHAESHLAALGIVEPLRPGILRGQYDDRFAWEQHVERFEPRTQLYRVQLDVHWRQGLASRRLTFDTLRLAATGSGE
jgi:general secretion pathway protein I